MAENTQNLKWISAQEQMPKQGELIIAAAPDYFYKVYRYHPQCRWHKKGRIQDLKFEERFAYWMPLPLLPEENRSYFTK